MPAIKTNDLLLRLVRDVNDIRSALRRVVSNLPLFDIANENTPTQLTVDQDNYVPGNYDILRLSSSQAVAITGFSGGLKGRSLRLFNVGSFEITLSYQSASSLAANRIISPTATDIILTPGDEIFLYYDYTQSRWISSYSSNADRITVLLNLPANQSIHNASTFSYLSWDTAVLDTGGFFDITTPTVITIPETGWYFFKTVVLWDVNGTNLRETFIENTAGGTLRVWDSRLAVSAAQTVITLMDLAYCTKGQQFRVGVWQNSGGALDVLLERVPTSPLVTTFSVTKA